MTALQQYICESRSLLISWRGGTMSDFGAFEVFALGSASYLILVWKNRLLPREANQPSASG